MQIPALIATFLGATQRTFRANTQRAYRSDLALFARSVPDLDAAAVTADHLRAFLAATRDHAPSTLARRQAALRSCFAWAYRNGLVPADPSTHLDKITLPHRDPRPLTKVEVDAVLAAIPARHARNRLLFTLLYETGLRVGEALDAPRGTSGAAGAHPGVGWRATPDVLSLVSRPVARR